MRRTGLPGCRLLLTAPARGEVHDPRDRRYRRDTTRHERGPDAASEHPGKAGIHALPDPLVAFSARVLLAEAAEKAIDTQYYIWHDDVSGNLLYEALWRAAGRGVRVRLLVDDNTTAGLDPTLAALDSHPSIEVRLYNPLTHRRVRALSYALSPRLLDRRMHNKSFTVDNQVTVVGGRNVGDEYFGAGQGAVFSDLDVLAVGPVVRDVSAEFDLFWNSPSATPAAGLLLPPGPTGSPAWNPASLPFEPTRRRRSTSVPSTSPQLWPSSSRARPRSSGPRPNWSTTTPRRLSTPSTETTFCFFLAC